MLDRAEVFGHVGHRVAQALVVERMARASSSCMPW
jgi:hypothetical protein